MFLRSRAFAALTPSPRRSNASALSGSANRGVLLARSKRANDFACVESTLCFQS